MKEGLPRGSGLDTLALAIAGGCLSPNPNPRERQLFCAESGEPVERVPWSVGVVLAQSNERCSDLDSSPALARDLF